MFGRGTGWKARKAEQRRKAGSIRKYGRKHGSAEQRRCAVAMHKFRFWLRADPLVTSEHDRTVLLANMRSAAREFPGCVPARYWKLVEKRIRALPVEKGDWD